VAGRSAGGLGCDYPKVVERLLVTVLS
jgi:hypothetical protein